MNSLHVQPGWQAALSALGFGTAAEFLEDGRVSVWRRMPERENGVLETERGRLHIKRYLTASGAREAEAEVAAAKLLAEAEIPAMEFAAWGSLPDGRAFTAAVDLAGYVSGQAFLREGGTFEEIAPTTAALAAKLHSAGLHHRDLYLCHFFCRPASRGGDGDCRLIDIARVGRLPRWMGRRWIIKDLAQFSYSTREFAIGEERVAAWLAAYARARGIEPSAMDGAILRKVEAIARHDLRLRERQPDRNVSIPQ